MGLQSLELCDFRNIETAQLEFSPGLNLVSGENAAGKTSLLEAIYCLGRVRSFRTSISKQLIRYQQPACRLVGQVALRTGRKVPIGIERQSSGLNVHLDGEPVRRLSDLAGHFPVQILSGDTQTIFNGGPRYRRQTLDWALFHVEQRYREVWQRYARVLRQRNAALRAHKPDDQIQVWNGELLETAGHIDNYRQHYFSLLEPHLANEIDLLLPGSSVSLRYQPGWPANTALSEILPTALARERALGYTCYGPHRGDFNILLNGHSVVGHCSRGQQKAVIAGFALAQIKLQQAESAPLGAFLLDDLGSELDAAHQARVMKALRELDAQVFVTAIDSNSIDLQGWQGARMFHVEHGCIRETG